MNSASSSTRFDELLFHLPVELRQDIFNYYLEEAVPRAIDEDVKFNHRLHLMFRVIYGICRGTTAVLPHTFELLNLIHCPGNPYFSNYTLGLVQNGFKTAESLRAEMESQIQCDRRWARSGDRRGASYKRYCRMFSYCYERKPAWGELRDWRDDYEQSRRRSLIGISWSAIMVPTGDDRARKLLWYTEILCQMRIGRGDQRRVEMLIV